MPLAQPKDDVKTGNECSSAYLTGWAAIEDYFKNHDEGVVKNCEEDINTLLVFAGLFSAVVTAFIIEFYNLLQPDTSQILIQLLTEISSQLRHNSTAHAQVSPMFLSATFRATSSARAINVLWFLSLVLSLAAALFGMIAKQWTREYLQWTALSCKPRDVVLLRQSRHEAWEDWKVSRTIGSISGLLELALLLFLGGMVILLRTLDIVVFVVITVAVAILFAVASATLILPIFYRRCPYKSQVGWGLILFCRWVHYLLRPRAPHPHTSEPWKQWDIHSEQSYQPNSFIVKQFDNEFKAGRDFAAYAVEVSALVKALAWVRVDSQNSHLLQNVDQAVRTIPRPGISSSDNILLARTLYLLCDHLSLNIHKIRQFLAEAYYSNTIQQTDHGKSLAYLFYSQSWSLRSAVNAALERNDMAWREQFVILLDLLANDLESYITSRLRTVEGQLFGHGKTSYIVDNLCFLMACCWEVGRQRQYHSLLLGVYNTLAGLHHTVEHLRHPSLRTFVFLLIQAEWDLKGSTRTLCLDKDGFINLNGANITDISYIPPPLVVYYRSKGFSTLATEDRHLFVLSSTDSLGRHLRIQPTISRHLLLAMSEAVAQSRAQGLADCGCYTHLPWIETLYALTVHYSDQKVDLVPSTSFLDNLERGLTDGLVTTATGKDDKTRMHLQALQNYCGPRWLLKQAFCLDTIKEAQFIFLYCLENGFDYSPFLLKAKKVLQCIEISLLESGDPDNTSAVTIFLENLAHAMEASIYHRNILGTFNVRMVHSPAHISWHNGKGTPSWIDTLFSLAEYPRTNAAFLQLVPERLVQLLIDGLDRGLVITGKGDAENAKECLRELKCVCAASYSSMGEC